jgi:AbrB family looped-hinge helix DNA binding protein
MGHIEGSWYDPRMSSIEHFNVALGERGRIVLPSQLRQRLNLQTGDRLIVTVDDEGGFRVVPARELARRLRGLYRDLAPGRSLVDELIAERREEARREDEP